MTQSDEYYQDTIQRLPHHRFGSLFSVISFLLGQGLSGGIYHCIALHIWFNEGLQGYITLLSEAINKSVTINHTCIEPEALQSHIENLHRAPIILAVCMSIAVNSVPRRPVLSALAAISPDHPVCNMVLDIVKWHIDDDAFLQSYCSDSRKVIPPGDGLRLKKNLREAVDLLTDWFGKAKDHNSGINWPLISDVLQSRDIGNPPWISMAKVEENAPWF
ncbi:hypothetical protein EDD85DRAFT_795131 [Armillaria nabsnona]|nr:hypothetical protein EDD85DRAFT_795131 [Armillaria nabsnona]